MSQPRIFLGAPCYQESSELLRKAICSFIEPNVEVLIVDNGRNEAVLSDFRGLIQVIFNEKNVYINPAWNQIAERFLETSASVLVIANADCVLSENWSGYLHAAMSQPYAFWHGRCVSDRGELLGHPRHTAGVFFAIPRELVAKCFPIPSDLRMWYGDSWIWRQLDRVGARPHVIEEIRVYHAGSVSSAQVPEMREIVEADRIAWEAHVTRGVEST